jgi:hypothetical protein
MTCSRCSIANISTLSLPGASKLSLGQALEKRAAASSSVPVRTTTKSAGRDSCFLAKEQSWAYRLARPLAAELDEARQPASART